MPLLSFKSEFILMSHFKMATENHHNHNESNIVYMRTQWTYYMQNRKYFRFVVAIMKYRFVVNSNSIYLTSVSSTWPEKYDYSSIGCTNKKQSLRKIHYLSYCKRFCHQIYSFYRGEFAPHMQQISSQYLLRFKNYNHLNLKV